MPRRPVHYLAPLVGIAPLAVLLTVGSASAQDGSVPEPSSFTSAFRVTLTDDQVPGGAGTPGASGTFDLRLNSDQEVLCYDITLRGVMPPFMSPARTATHVHQGAPGGPGPVRVVFPDPQSGSGDTRTGSGCVKVPQETGVVPMGQTADAGAGFSLKRIEADPTAFYGDNHTQMNPMGSVRGQFGSAVPVGGVATGLGGTAESPSVALTAALGAGAVLALGGAGLAVRRRARA